MPALRNSRYQHSTTYTDTAGRSFLTEPPLIPYVDSLDNRVHTVTAGERLQDIAHRYFEDLGSTGGTFPAAALWYIVAQFQPTPIIDPTLRLTPGVRLYIPSKAYVLARVFAKSRRDK